MVSARAVCALALVCVLFIDRVEDASAKKIISTPGGRCGKVKGNSYVCPKHYCCAANWRCARSQWQCDVNNGCHNGQYGWCWNKKKKSSSNLKKRTSKPKARPSKAAPAANDNGGGLLDGLASTVSQIVETVTDVALPSNLLAGGAAGDQNKGDITYYQGVRVMCGQYVNPQRGTYAAISYKLADALNPTGQWPPVWCNRRARIYGLSGGREEYADVYVVDRCASCEGAGDIDVAMNIFEDVVGDKIVGRTKVTWKWLD